MIILEGPDNSGKSTFARRLQREYGYKIVKHTQHTTYEEFIEWLANPSTALERVVLDRCVALSEPVYGPLLRNDSARFTSKQYDNMYLLLQSHRPQVVHFTDVAADFSTREQLPSEEQNQRAAEEYVHQAIGVWKRLFAVSTYSWRSDESGQYPVASLVRADVGSPIWWEQLFRDKCAGVGKLSSPRYFILAESIGPRNTNHIPFEAGPSGVFMTQLLSASRTPLHEVYITNYVKASYDEEQNLAAVRTEIEQTKPQGVIVMGSIARRATPVLEELGMVKTYIVHPSYVLRSGGDKANYINAFRQAKRLIDGNL